MNKFFAFLLIPFVSGCVGPHLYHGDKLPDSELAFIYNKIAYDDDEYTKSLVSLYHSYVILRKVDDFDCEKYGYVNGCASHWDSQLKVAVKEGSHRLEVGFQSTSFSGTTRSTKDMVVEFYAIKGHNYLLDFQVMGGEWTPTLYDITAAKRVYP